jgi:hypothetical protein
MQTWRRRSTAEGHTQALMVILIYPINPELSLIFRTNFTCTKCILNTLPILQHVSTHHTCHHQGLFVVVIVTLSSGPLCNEFLLLLLLPSVGLPVANAPDVLQPYGLLYCPFKLSPPVVSPGDPGSQRRSLNKHRSSLYNTEGS